MRIHAFSYSLWYNRSMSKLQKKLVIFLSMAMILSLSINISLFRAMNTIPNTLDIDYITLKDEKIPESMNDISILYFTDLQYGQFQDDTRTQALFEKIQYMDPDILLFGGDLFDTDTQITEEIKQKMIQWFKQISSPLGKFAVWGEKDVNDPAKQDMILNIYRESDIEVLDNATINLFNRSKEYIHLTGLGLSPNVDTAFSNIANETYHLLFTHYPDNLLQESLATHAIGYALTGHSHGTQIMLPVIGGIATIEGAKKLNRANTQSLSFPYTISAGIGCTKANVRLNATPTLHYLTLKKAT